MTLETAVVTGSTGKLGQNSVMHLLKRGMKVLAPVRDVALARDCFGNHKQYFPVFCDLSNGESIKNFYHSISDHTKNINYVVNIAAVDIDASLTDVLDSDLNNLISINLVAPYLIVKYALPYMSTQPARIVNVSSVLSERPVTHSVEYAMSKGGLNSMTKALAVELGKKGITANAILIGGMRGPLSKASAYSVQRSPIDENYDDWKTKKDKIPLARRGNFDEFVSVISFLCSDKSAYVTGVLLPVDGGILAQQ